MTGGTVEIILLAMVAGFLVLRLRSVLGRRQGFERPPQAEAGRPATIRAARGPADGPSRGGAARLPRRAAAAAPFPIARSPVGQALSRIAGPGCELRPVALPGRRRGGLPHDRAGLRGERPGTLRALLSDDAYAGFAKVLDAREAAGEHQRTELRAVHEVAIEAADLRGKVADITVRFVTDQINMTTGRNGEVVSGSDAVTELTDLWTFQRDLTSADPTWKLVGTGSQ